MTKPLGYFCNFKPNDGSFLAKLEDEYGSRLESLNDIQKTHLLTQLAQSLLNIEISKIGTMIADKELQVSDQISTAIYKKLPIGEHLPLIKAIIENL
jgi:hypothetical protein